MGENQQRIVRAAARDAFLRFGEGGLISGAAVLEFVEGSTYAEACHQHEFEHAWAEADRHQRGALDEREFQSFLLAVDRFAAAAAAPEPAPATVPAPAPPPPPAAPEPVPVAPPAPAPVPVVAPPPPAAPAPKPVPVAPPAPAPAPAPAPPAPVPARAAAPASPIRPDDHWIGTRAAAPEPAPAPAPPPPAPPSPSPQSKLAAFLEAVPASPTLPRPPPARSPSKLAAFVAATPNPGSPTTTPSKAFATPPEPRVAAAPPPPPSSPSKLAAFVAAVPNPASPVASRKAAPAPASPPRPARHQPVLPEQPFVSSLPSPATLNVEEEARAPDPPPPTVDEATEPARAPDPIIVDEATLSIAATRTMVTVETQTPIQTQKPVANPTSAKKQRPARKPAPPEAELAALDEEARRCAEIRTSLRVLTDPHNFAGAPIARADPLPTLSEEPSQKLDAQKAPTLRSAHSAQRHVDRVREGIAKKAAAKTPGATRERAMAAKRSFSSVRKPPTSPQRPARQGRRAIAQPWALGRPKVKSVKTKPERFRRPPLAVLVSAARNLPELRKSIMRGNLRRQYRVAGRVAWAEGGEAHFRTKVRYDSLDFGDQICYVEVPRKIDPSKAVVQFFVLYGGGDDVLAAGGAHMADLGELKWLPLKRGSAAAAGKVRGGALHVRAYVASPADLKQLNAPPAPRAAQRVADPVKWAVATPSLLKQRYESALRSAASPADVAEDLKRYHATLLTAQSMGDDPPATVQNAQTPSMSSYFAGADASPSPSPPNRNGRVSFDRSASASTDASSSARSPPE